MDESGTELQRDAARFSRAYIATLIVIGLLALSTYAILRLMIPAQQSVAHSIDTAGSQRMLSQRISLLVTELAASPGRADLLASLATARARFARHHEGLIAGDAELGLAGVTTETLRALYFDAPHDVDAHVRAVIDLADRTLTDRHPPPGFEEGIALAKGPLLVGLNEVVAARKQEARETLSRYVLAETLCLAVTMLVLLAAGLLFFRPLDRRLQRGVAYLLETHDTLRASSRRDSLTELPNRRSLHEHLGLTLNSAARQSQSVGVCHFDLSGFRQLNERMGHEVGDRVLLHVASVIKAETRRGDFIARIGADEFVVVSPNVSDIDGLKWLGRRIANRIAEPLTLDGAVCRTSASVGIAVAAPGATAVRRLLLDAELALRESKKLGEAVLCTPNLRTAHDTQQALRDDLDGALERREIEPWFQPQICARTGAIDGFEALARWHHPTKGLLSPAHFIDAATEFGFGDRLAEAILDQSLSALLAWRKEGLVVPCIGVNFAAEHLSDPFMVEKIKWAVEARSLAAGDICIEILESVLVDDLRTDTAQNIKALARAGFRVDLDDFGTGRASIATLQRFPIDRIKIDRSFITNIDRHPDQQKVTGAMIELAHSLGVKALAEGVETPAEWAKLAGLGCDHLQGFAIGHPMPPDQVSQWVTNWTRRLAETG